MIFYIITVAIGILFSRYAKANIVVTVDILLSVFVLIWAKFGSNLEEKGFAKMLIIPFVLLFTISSFVWLFLVEQNEWMDSLGKILLK